MADMKKVYDDLIIINLYLPQNRWQPIISTNLQEFRSKKQPTLSTYYAFIQYGNFFELTRDLKKHFSKLNFDKCMIYCWHLKHPPY